MPASHQFCATWTPQKFIIWGDEKGKFVKEMIEVMLNTAKHPEQAFKTCMGILSLSGTYGNKRLNDACARALSYDCYSYKKVKNILEQGLDKIQENFQSSSLPEHENIRGSSYYH
jgi:hypothetical protein